MSILSILFSKLGAYLAGAIALIGLWLGYKHQKAKREQAEARVEVVETTLEVKDEIERREAIVDDMQPDDIIDAFGGVRRKTSDSKAPTS